MIELRNQEFPQALIYGSFTPLENVADNIIAYERRNADQRLISITNMSDQPLSYAIPQGEVVLNNYDSVDSTLKPYQTILLKGCVKNEQI